MRAGSQQCRCDENSSPKYIKVLQTPASQATAGRCAELIGEIMSQTNIQRPCNGVEIVHAIPGRVRLSPTAKLAPAGLLGERYRASNKTWETLLAVSEQLQQQPGIKKVSLNQHSKSALIIFDEQVLALKTLVGILEAMGVENAFSQTPAQNLSEPLEAVGAGLSKLFVGSMNLGDSVSVAKAIPAPTTYIVGILLAQQLGITGLSVLPFYLLAAGAAKQVLEEYGETAAPNGLDNQYRIAHAVPGRLRYEIKRLTQDEVYARRLERSIRELPGVTGTRINRSNASLVVIYNTRLASLAQIQKLLEQAICPSPETPKQENLETPRLTDEKTQRVPEKIGLCVAPYKVSRVAKTLCPPPDTGFWTQYKPPALKMCLAYLAKL